MSHNDRLSLKNRRDTTNAAVALTDVGATYFHSSRSFVVLFHCAEHSSRVSCSRCFVLFFFIRRSFSPHAHLVGCFRIAGCMSPSSTCPASVFLLHFFSSLYVHNDLPPPRYPFPQRLARSSRIFAVVCFYFRHDNCFLFCL